MTFPKRILLVDREPPVTRLVRQAPAKTGKYLVKEEHNGQILFHIPQRFQSDFIFFDLTIHERGGGAAPRQRQMDVTFRDTPIVIVTKSASDETIAYGGSLGGSEFSADPVKIGKLVRCVDELLAA